ncbi:MetQ/NlpA family ABC transporter substrate-binding protein (plasmid) [Companilactobacillus allii]|uniref:Lipoprotein n=1 Tax=Companilactobacillus allii TaxID=1847728 RepID=A0A1P8Q5Y7_9LACO|nr:MetQ/NlpA family ABC transporter substrate-binding protein [Companilactobacillus allii]APX73268.1 metal ABC transporter substrate-binding protein [Companilactobacillus allii]USQ68084.1 MetQ/NlpA family ABC transporter substrate-binding protein [Companilactobacillus allii]USQ69932.1 MetQ/NlpA family ABC transporter substrate-binding protein [Companilactobacillus allii]
MNKKIKGIFAVLLTALSVFILAGCGNSSAANKVTTVKVGITGSDDRVWKAVNKKLAKENIKVKLVEFSDYSQPNTALDQGEVDLNAFQTVYFQNNWNKTHHTNIVSIGDTVIAPMALYSKKISNLSEIKEGDSIAVPNDATNEGRALQLLESAGLIKLDKAALPTPKDITENKLNLNIKQLDAAQTARSMGDVTASVVNSGVANDAKLNPKKAVYREKITAKSKPYVNIISANKKDKNNKTYKKIVKAYQSAEIAKKIKEVYGDYEKPAWNYKVLQ